MDADFTISVGFEQSEFTVIEGSMFEIALNISGNLEEIQTRLTFSPQRDLQLVTEDGVPVPLCESI